MVNSKTETAGERKHGNKNTLTTYPFRANHSTFVSIPTTNFV